MSDALTNNGRAPIEPSSADQRHAQLMLFWASALDRLKQHLEGQGREQIDPPDSGKATPPQSDEPTRPNAD